MKFCFGDIVVIECYFESEMERYMVRHKFLDELELEWQRNAVGGR